MTEKTSVAVTYVEELTDFLNSNYKKELDLISGDYPNRRSVEIDYSELEKYSPDIADDLIANPNTIILACEEAIASMDLLSNAGDPVQLHVRFNNLPNRVLIRNIDSAHINKLVSVEGVITKITDVRPKVQEAVFECVHCGRIIKYAQTSEGFGKLTEPTACPQCERKGFKLNLKETKWVNVQKMQIQEPIEAIVRGENAKTIDVWMEDDLTKIIYPGDKLIVTGVVNLNAPKTKTAVYGIFMDAVHCQKLEEDFEEIEIGQEEEKEILELSKDPNLYKKIVASIAPTIYGHDEIKQALALQLLGGSKNKVLTDGSRARAEPHILLIGDPGVAKSRLLRFIGDLAPKCIVIGGGEASGGGLTAIAERKDDFGEGGWTIKAGAMVIANNGIVALDELDKLDQAERGKLHNAMESQKLNIAKAGIITAFKTETAVLAAANPKYGRFDSYASLAEQFAITPTLLNRFDLIFPLKDVLDSERDGNLADHIIATHQVAAMENGENTKILNEEEFEEAKKRGTPVIEPVLLRKYIAYARKYYNPALSKEAGDKLKEYYIKLREAGEKNGAVPITPRQMDGLIRLAEASAKGRLSSIVEVEDTERAIELNQFVMNQVGIDPETGKYDVDIFMTGTPRSEREKLRNLWSLIKTLNDEFDLVTFDMIVKDAKALNIEAKEVEKLLKVLQKNGDVFSPKHGQYRVSRE